MIFEVVDKISAVLKKFLRVLIFTIMSCMVISVLTQVFTRFVLHIGVSWTEEMARTFFVYMIFIGIALVEEEGSQVRITFIIDKLPKIPYFILNTFILVCEFIFLVFVFIGSIKVWEYAAQVSYVFAPSVSYRVLYIPFYVGTPLTMWFLFRQELQLIKKTFYADKAEQKEEQKGDAK